MKITCLTVGPVACNCYVLVDEAEGAGAVIDPGGDADLILRECEQVGIAPRYLIVTHDHADHIAALPDLASRFPDAHVCIGRDDAPGLADPARSLTAMIGLTEGMPEPDVLLEDGDEVRFGGSVLRVIGTPGHTPGGISLVAESQAPQLIFCGDLVFRGGLGRTDLPGSSFETLRRSIEEKIFGFPDDTVLLPGHGDATTVGDERRSVSRFW